ncbi:hypothetical protein KT999_17745 [Proteus mirabilis]|uniref:EcpB family pilus assembly chaperone n=2 Tax=Proteus mirabilis TaxID=584 RepID=UPI001FACE52E|nr:hypothetical protein [Proteus mirabilis]MCI9780107.1 hypothetical protein [Proteus mirabilis]MCT0100877.1 hypothetical protein [Proteus mirabilis]MEC3991928.1 hypothetical protein [Proteus mirabilis]MEC4040686.1 hypothetical protein [Proteus mirabilis]MEC4068817.1 hypothetical protein [Proteus mirabilis]
MKKNIFLSFLVLFSIKSMAIDVGNITEFIETDNDLLTKEIKNTVASARLVNLSVQKISSPMGDGVEIPLESNNEILSTPSNLILPSNASDIFKIIYDGPKDDKERYYRLNWTDDPVSENNITNSSKSAKATTSATISTILVVAPRVENFSYSYANNIIKNNGNSSFRVVASGPCLSAMSKYGINNICKERYYMMPNKELSLQRVDIESKKSSIGIWHNNNFIVIK